MQKVFFLKTCGTCTKILNRYDPSNWELRELKSSPITPQELAEMFQFTQSYEALFSRRSTEIKKRNIDLTSLKEIDFKSLILDHYSFLKRPVFITDKIIFIGNEKKNLENLDQYFSVF